MARPPDPQLTQRELDVMHVYWRHGDLTAQEARDLLAKAGTDLAYVTVANLVRILVEKDCLTATTDERPFRYRSRRSFEEISQSLVGDLLKRVFQGSREQLLVQILGQKRLTSRERAVLEDILKEDAP
jgi:BlaI family transcriptional regulator, penicillinase repressor